MPATLEAAAIIAIFVVPGFVGFYVARELTPFPIREVSDVEMVLLSTAFATVILTLEVVAYGALSLMAPEWPVLAGFTSAEIWNPGYREAFQSDPARVGGIFSAQFVLHCLIVGVVGWQDPLGKRLERARKACGTSGEDVWTRGLIALRQEKGFPATSVRAVLDTGETYTGTLSKISNSPDDDGNRDLVLQAVSKSASPEERPMLLHPERPHDTVVTVVALSTRNIRAVEAIFHDQFE